MGHSFTPEEIDERKAFLQAHLPNPDYDEKAELFGGDLPPEEFETRCVQDILENWDKLPVSNN